MRFISLFALLLLSSCQAVFTGIYGIREPAQLAAGELPKLAVMYGIPPNSRSAVLDTSFWRFIRRMQQQAPNVAKNHYQLLQAVYYDAAGRQQSFHINCYAGGFPNLHWNANGILAHFPPAQQAPRDTALTLAEHLRYLRPLALPTLPPDYTVVVHWSRFTTRQSRRLIRAVRQNVALAPAGTRVTTVFVNTDDFYYLAYKREAERMATTQQENPAK
ncbi:hypothetical protein [Hymenobacter rubidus]|uniref:hypothetical protein n=1 Tax=Hymenobacter rubidus TaxID=1441626 RepID=UPI00191EC30E|nr:hypothetical protein [Hymenobacter rubidus]